MYSVCVVDRGSDEKKAGELGSRLGGQRWEITPIFPGDDIVRF